MKTFKDNSGRTWSISLTIDAFRRIKAHLGLDLMLVLNGDSPGELPLITRLGTDVMLLVDAVFVAVKPEADRLAVSDEDFGRAMGGEAILAARTAFFEELSDFFRGLGRLELVAAISKQEEVVRQAVRAIQIRVHAIDAEALIDKALRSGPGQAPGSLLESAG